MSARFQTAWFPRLTGLLIRSLREDARKDASVFNRDFVRQVTLAAGVSLCIGVLGHVLLGLIAIGSVAGATFKSQFAATLSFALAAGPALIAMLLPGAVDQFSRSLPWSIETKAAVAIVAFLVTNGLSVWILAGRIHAEFLRLASE